MTTGDLWLGLVVVVLVAVAALLAMAETAVMQARERDLLRRFGPGAGGPA